MRVGHIPITVAVTGALLLAFALGASAQMDMLKNTSPEQRAETLTKLMQSKLDLTSTETPRVADINLKYAQKMEPIIQGADGPFMKMRHMKEVNDEKEAELKQVLTPQQWDKFQASKEELREKFEEKMQQKIQENAATKGAAE